MNAQGRNQRPGVSAPREAAATRTAPLINAGRVSTTPSGAKRLVAAGTETDTGSTPRKDKASQPTSFIRFGRAEEAAQEAQKREAARRAVERQAQLNAYEAEMNRARQTSSVPVGSAIPNSDRGQRTATGEENPSYGANYADYSGNYPSSAPSAHASSAAPLPRPRRQTDLQAQYPTPYAAQGSSGTALPQMHQLNPRIPNQQRLGRTASTSAALRERTPADAASRRAKPSSKQRPKHQTHQAHQARQTRAPLMFFCLIFIVIALSRTIAFGVGIEAGIARNLANTDTLAQFLMDNHVELNSVLPGSAWAALRVFMLSLIIGFITNVFAWYNSNKPTRLNKAIAAVSTLCYVIAVFTAPYRNIAPTVCLTVLPAMLGSAASLYSLSMLNTKPSTSKGSRSATARSSAASRSRFIQ